MAGSSFAITALKKAKEAWEAAKRAKIVAEAAEVLLAQIIALDSPAALTTCSAYSEYFEVFNYVSDNVLNLLKSHITCFVGCVWIFASSHAGC